MLAEIVIWWSDQMRSLVPGSKLRADRQEDALIVAVNSFGDAGVGDDRAVTGSILLRRDGVETEIQSLSLEHELPAMTATPLATGLRLPYGAVLSRDVLLPIAAARNLRAVIGFEMDRLTPFTTDAVYWDVCNVMPDRTRGRISLQLNIVLRAQVDALKQILSRIGLTPSFVEFEAARINLGEVQPRQGRGWRTCLPALCGGLFVACLASPFIRQQTALNAAAQAIAAYQPAADAQALHQKLATAAAGYAAIAQARQAGDALPVLAALTSVLPDNTFLSDLTLKSGDLAFDGQSANAAQLIGLLSAAQGLQNPSFTAPVTRTTDGKSDLFSMHVSVRP